MSKNCDKCLRYSRKAQVTVFVIVGIIILFVISFALYIKSSTSNVRPPIEQLEVSDEIKPLQNYVTSCLMQVSKDGLIRIGNTGGFINISGKKISPLSYDSDVYLFEPLMMPYWYYAAKCPENELGCLKSHTPPLCRQGVVCALDYTGDNSIEDQLSRFIESNMAQCINDFEPFKNTLSIKAGRIRVETIVREETVDFKMSYPLDITVLASNKKAKVPYFVASQDVALKKIYEYAREIMLTESEHKFLEVSVMNLVAIYSGLDNNLLPPTRELEIMSADKKFWTRSGVRNMLRDDVLPYLNYVRFVNAENYAPMISFDDSNYSIYSNGIYKSLEIKTSNNTYPLDARLIYAYPEIYFDVDGTEIIKPENMDVGDNPLLKMLGILITYYDFGYDISFPVIVQIHDNSAFNGEGYSFSYSMEANIRDNVPLSGNLTLINTGSGEDVIDMTSEEQMPERIISITSFDKHTKKPLDGVNLYYRCGREYELGATALNNDGDAVWSGRIPYCEFGGELLYMKYGYMGSGLDMNNPEGSDNKDLRLDMWPIKEKNVVVYKRTPENINNIINYGAGSIVLFSSEKESLTSLDKAFITFNKVKQDYREDDVPMVGFILYQPLSNNVLNKSQYLDIISQSLPESERDALLPEYRQTLMESGDLTPVLDEKKYSFALVPGQYEYSITMIYGGNILIPAKKDTICIGKRVAGVCIGQEKQVDYPAQNLTEWVSGGSSGLFTLTENDLYSDKTLALYVLEMPLPYDWESLSTYETPEQYQEGRTFLSRPRFE